MQEETQNLGALIDSRPESEKEKDYRLEEIVASVAPVEWIEKKESEWRKFPIFDQNGSGSCVAQTARKMLGVYCQLKGGGFVPLSASHIYQRRVNRPDGGMIADDCFKIMQKGTTLELFAQSEKLSDSKMDAVVVSEFDAKIGEAFKIGNYVVAGAKDIDLVASLIQQTGKAVMVWFYFKNDEWKAVPEIKYPDLSLTGSSTARHSVAAVDFTLYKGKKALIIDDSWGPNAGNGAGQRIITEDFFKERNWFVAHFMNFSFEENKKDDTISKPKYTFTKDLEFSDTYKTDSDVIALQDILKYEGFFPINTDSTGYFGSITKKAVQQFQTKYSIAIPSDPGYGRVGPKTRAKLNELYA